MRHRKLHQKKFKVTLKGEVWKAQRRKKRYSIIKCMAVSACIVCVCACTHMSFSVSACQSSINQYKAGSCLQIIGQPGYKVKPCLNQINKRLGIYVRSQTPNKRLKCLLTYQSRLVRPPVSLSPYLLQGPPVCHTLPYPNRLGFPFPRFSESVITLPSQLPPLTSWLQVSLLFLSPLSSLGPVQSASNVHLWDICRLCEDTLLWLV